MSSRQDYPIGDTEYGQMVQISQSEPLPQAAASGFTVAQKSPTTTVSVVVPANSSRKRVVLVNHGIVDLYLGPTSGVATTSGFKLAGGASLTMESLGAVFGITSSGTATIHVLEESY